MKGKEVSMTNLRQVLQRLRAKQSIRSIALEVGLHRRVIRKMHDLSMQNEWLNPDMPMPTDEEILRGWNGDKIPDQEHVLDQYKQKIKEWHNTHHTAVVIQRLLKEAVADRIDVDVQAIRRYLKKHHPKKIKPVMVRNTVPGKDADVDFGDVGYFEDDDGKRKKVNLISLRLRHSRKAYRELVTDQKSTTFNKVHINAFEFFGGVVAFIHPDCTKCAVIKASIDNNNLNRSYQSLAEHYGFSISPCRPYTPEHKGGVEKDMDYCKRDFLARFKLR